MISVVRTGGGYRVRCLRCGLLGPERENVEAAWEALKRERRSFP